MKITQKDRIFYIKDPEGYIKKNKPSKREIIALEDSIKGSPRPTRCKNK